MTQQPGRGGLPESADLAAKVHREKPAILIKHEHMHRADRVLIRKTDLALLAPADSRATGSHPLSKRVHL